MDWLVVTSAENFARTRDLHFTVQGFKSRHLKKVDRVLPGDRLAYYLKGEGTFAATSRVTSALFEERSRIWQSPGNASEMYPWRVRTEPELLVPESRRPRASDIADKLEFVRKWPRPHWRLAFQGMLHALPVADGELIYGLLRPVCAPLSGARTSDAPGLE